MKNKNRKKTTTTVSIAAAIAVAALILPPLLLLTTTMMTTTIPAAAAQIISSPIKLSSPNSEGVVGTRVFSDLETINILQVLSDNFLKQAQTNTVVVQQEKVDRVGLFEPTTSAML